MLLAKEPPNMGDLFVTLIGIIVALATFAVLSAPRKPRYGAEDKDESPTGRKVERRLSATMASLI